jgi:hypothetical protein
MRNFLHLEGQNFAFNLNRVDYFIKSHEEATPSAPSKFVITFYSNEIKVGIWIFESQEVRDSVFLSLVDSSFNHTGLLTADTII